MVASVRGVGRCVCCGRELSAAGMSRHLATCKGRPVGKGRSFHLLFESEERPEFWMHLEANVTTTFQAVDGTLRALWLECCGHLSAFEIRGERVVTVPDDEYGLGGLPMRTRLDRLMAPGVRFTYEYDYGSTTSLVGRCVSVVEGTKRAPTVRVIARNLPPLYPCARCQSEATMALWEEPLCDGCTEASGEAECALPLVDSPRWGGGAATTGTPDLGQFRARRDGDR